MSDNLLADGYEGPAPACIERKKIGRQTGPPEGKCFNICRKRPCQRLVAVSPNPLPFHFTDHTLIEPTDAIGIYVPMVRGHVNMEPPADQKVKQLLDEACFAPLPNLARKTTFSEHGAVDQFVDHVDDDTEDLFFWDNDLANDLSRVLRINSTSRFFAGLGELEMDNRIRPLLNRYADFDFRIDTTEWTVKFSRVVQTAGTTATIEDIKISRGEENIFIWCFFLAIVQLALDEAEAYKWVKYVYIDDPISSLDESNAVIRFATAA